MTNAFRNLAAMLFVGLAATPGTAQSVDFALRNGTAWLLKHQDADGGWRSRTYGQMSSGVGNTALVLDALTKLPPSLRRDGGPAIDRGIEFLLRDISLDGYVSAPNDAADYPLYATALSCSTLDRFPSERGREQQRRLRAYLFAAQRGGNEGEPLRGGWPQVGGPLDDAHAETNVNISVTRFALEAVREELKDSPDARHHALAFLGRCQNDDGGFRFLPLKDDPLNKAGVDGGGVPRSYGTATADGILALLACGIAHDEPRVQHAIRWLDSHPSLNSVPGLDSETATVSHAADALLFYYYAALADVVAKFPDSAVAGQGKEIKSRLVTLQHADGSWGNPNSLMREDDPLIATAFAIVALATLE